jgi:nucleotide-binding universal stress UspA family protein
MIIPKRILVPTDFSPTAEKALRFAIDLARRTGAAVLHYHVFIPAEGSFAGKEEDLQKINEEERTIRLKKLERLTQKVLGSIAADTMEKETATQKFMPQVSCEIGVAPLIDSIIDYAQNKEADAIVMGTQGASGLKQVLIGSTATRMLQRSPLPVWLIPEEMEGSLVNQLVCAATYLPETAQYIQEIYSLAEVLDAGLTVVHISDMDDYAHDREKEIQAFRHFEANTRSAMQDIPIQFRMIESHGTLAGLEKLDEEFSYDVLIMVRRRKNFWEKLMEKSFTRHMACVTEKALLVLPEKH